MHPFCVFIIGLLVFGNLFISYLGSHRVYDYLAEDSSGDIADWGIITMLTSVVLTLPGLLVFSLIRHDVPRPILPISIQGVDTPTENPTEDPSEETPLLQ